MIVGKIRFMASHQAIRRRIKLSSIFPLFRFIHTIFINIRLANPANGDNLRPSFFTRDSVSRYLTRDLDVVHGKSTG